MASLTSVETSYGSGSRPLGPLTWAALRAMDTSGLRAGDFVEVSDLGYSHWIWNGTLWRPRSTVLVPATTALASLTGTLVETTMATALIPASAMGPTGSVRITVAATAPVNNANAKSLRVKFAGVTYQTMALANLLSGQSMVLIRNVAVASQKAFNGTYGTSSLAALTSAVNTAADVPILVTGQLGVVGDTLNLDGLTIELFS